MAQLDIPRLKRVSRFCVPKRFGYLIWIPALKQIHPWDLNNLNMSKFCLSAAFDLGFARKNYGISSSNCDWLANIPMLECFFTWLPITSYSHIVDTSHKTRALRWISVQPLCNRYIFLIAAIKNICSSRMPAENSRDFSPEDVCPRKGYGFNAVSSSSLLGEDDLIFNLTCSNARQRTQHLETVDCETSSQLSAVEKNWSTWGIFFWVETDLRRGRSWQNFFLLFTDRYDQFEANAKTCM